ncbi:uncharacterized protein ACDP82_019220 isoform 3-T7 [Pangshura tecta]
MKSRRSRPDIIIMPKESEEKLLTSHMHQSNEEVNEMMSKILGDLEPTELILRKQLPLKNLQEIITQQKQNTYVDSDLSQKIGSVGQILARQNSQPPENPEPAIGAQGRSWLYLF